MKTRQELTEILDFIAEYATYLLGSGVHTSRVIRNSQRIGASQGVDLQLSSFQKSTIITAHDEESGEAITRVVKIPALPVSFERNSDLSALSWDALDEGLPLSEIRKRYDELTAKPRIDPIFVLLTVGLANASFCRLFGGDWIAMGIVFTSTLDHAARHGEESFDPRLGSGVSGKALTAVEADATPGRSLLVSTTRNSGLTLRIETLNEVAGGKRADSTAEATDI